MTLALPVPAQVEPECLLVLRPLRLPAGLILGTRGDTVRAREWELPLSPYNPNPQASACLRSVWVMAEGKETSEESGILGSNPSSDICFLDGPGEL